MTVLGSDGRRIAATSVPGGVLMDAFGRRLAPRDEAAPAPAGGDLVYMLSQGVGGLPEATFRITVLYDPVADSFDPDVRSMAAAADYPDEMEPFGAFHAAIKDNSSPITGIQVDGFDDYYDTVGGTGGLYSANESNSRWYRQNKPFPATALTIGVDPFQPKLLGARGSRVMFARLTTQEIKVWNQITDALETTVTAPSTTTALYGQSMSPNGNMWWLDSANDLHEYDGSWTNHGQHASVVTTHPSKSLWASADDSVWCVMYNSSGVRTTITRWNGTTWDLFWQITDAAHNFVALFAVQQKIWDDGRAVLTHGIGHRILLLDLNAGVSGAAILGEVDWTTGLVQGSSTIWGEFPEDFYIDQGLGLRRVQFNSLADRYNSLVGVRGDALGTWAGPAEASNIALPAWLTSERFFGRALP